MGVFRYLQSKNLWRSQKIGASIASRIFMALFILYFGAIFLALGLFFNDVIDNSEIAGDPLFLLHQYLFYYLLFELVMRVIFQEVSEVNYRQLALLPIKRSAIIHFILRGSAISFFNILPLFFIFPFAYKYLAPTYTILGVFAWVLAVICLLLFNNYVALQIKHWVTKNPMFYIFPIIFSSGLYLIDSQGWIPISTGFDKLMTFTLTTYFPVLIHLIVALSMYMIVHRRMHRQAYISGDLITSKPFLERLNFNGLDDRGFFGTVAQMNLQLMFRNKRIRTQIIMGAVFLLYGLVIYNQDRNGPTMLLFWGLYMTGIVALSFAQYIWSYQGSYVELLWTLPIPLKQYLKAQYDFLILACVVTTIPSLLYYFINPDVLMINITAFIFNIGINIPFLLFASAYSKKKIDIGSSGTFNMQGINGAQFLFIFIVLLAPLFIYAPFSIYNKKELGWIILSAIGVIGLLLRPIVIKGLVDLIQEKKYGLTEGFRAN